MFSKFIFCKVDNKDSNKTGKIKSSDLNYKDITKYIFSIHL